LDPDRRQLAARAGCPGTQDLTVTSTDTAAVGERVQVTALVAVDQDFGSGPSYPVMGTDAVLTGG
jgi:hypothetical protein